MVVEQIDLVDIEQAPVGFGQQARFKGTNAITERLLDVNGSAQSVFRGPQWQVNHRHLALLGPQGFPVFEALNHVAALQIRIRGRAVVWVACHHLNPGQQVSQSPDGGGFARAPIAHDHHPADAGINHVQQKGKLHLLLADHSGEREDSALAR